MAVAWFVVRSTPVSPAFHFGLLVYIEMHTVKHIAFQLLFIFMYHSRMTSRLASSTWKVMKGGALWLEPSARHAVGLWEFLTLQFTRSRVQCGLIMPSSIRWLCHFYTLFIYLLVCFPVYVSILCIYVCMSSCLYISMFVCMSVCVSNTTFGKLY